MIQCLGMSRHLMKPVAQRLSPGLVWLVCLLMRAPLVPQEVPLEHCDRLPAIRVEVAGEKPMLFLVDTAATSLLNLRSFSLGNNREVAISSYRGTASTRAREVSPPEIKIGSYHLVGVKMMAIDLSALGASCGRRIDGILGADLLERMGATIDFKRQIVHFMTSDERREEKLMGAARNDVEHCLAAVSAQDEKQLSECLGPEVTLFAGGSAVYRREQALTWLRENYFHTQSQPHAGAEARIEAHATNFHVVGEAVWFEYDFDLTNSGNALHKRGMAMCRKSNGRWRIAGISPVNISPQSYWGTEESEIH